MPRLETDQLETLKMRVVNGVVRSLTSRARIIELTSTSYAVLMEAYQIAGLPAHNSRLPNPPNGTLADFSQLVLAEHDFSLVDKDKKTVDVDLHYQHFMDGDNQRLSPIGNFGANKPAVFNTKAVYGKSRASVQQSKTNFINSYKTAADWDTDTDYPRFSIVLYKGLFWRAVIAQPAGNPPPPGPVAAPVGDNWQPITEDQIPGPALTDPIRRQIVVGHKFDNPDEKNVKGQTLYQTGEITFMQPQENKKLHGYVYGSNATINRIKRELSGSISSVPWMDKPAYTWLCAEVAEEPMYADWQWKMSFEFQYNPDTWLPTATFNDQRTGRPPPNMIANFGYRQLHRQKEVNFENYFLVNFNIAPSIGV